MKGAKMRTNGNLRARIGKTFGNRWFGLLVAGAGVGAAVFYLLRDTAQGKRPRNIKNAVDDRGTGQDEASQILRNLRDRAFEANDEKLAVALGRPREEVEAWRTGQEIIDDDVVMKARGIAMHRGVRIE